MRHCGGCALKHDPPAAPATAHRGQASIVAGQARTAGLLLAIFGAITFSGKAIIVKLAYRYGVDPVTLIMLRRLFALPIFAAMGWWASRGKPPLSLADWLGVVGLGRRGRHRCRAQDKQ